MGARHFHSKSWRMWRDAILRAVGRAAKSRAAKPVPLEDAIHDCRAQLKIARALLRLAPRSVRQQAREIRGNLGRIADGLAAARNHHVLGNVFRRLAHHPDMIGTESGARFLAYASITSQTNTDLAASDSAALGRARSALKAAQNDIRALREPTEPRRALHKAAKRLSLRAKRRRPVNFLTSPPRELHRFRSAITVDMHQKRFFRTLLGAPARETIHRLDKLRTTLGAFNDLEMASQSLAETAANIAPRLAILERQDGLRKRLARQCRKI